MLPLYQDTHKIQNIIPNSIKKTKEKSHTIKENS